MKHAGTLMGLVLLVVGGSGTLFAVPSYDPFADARASGGTAYTNGGTLYHQTNAFGEGWALWNGGSGSATAAVKCINNGLAYAGFPAGFPAPSPTNSVLVPGLDQGVNASGYSAALMFSRSVAADANNLVTNKIYASFLLKVPGLGNLATTGTKPIYFGGFNNSTGGDQNTTVPGRSFKLFLEGNAATVGASTQWALGIADNSGGSTERFDPTFRATNTVLFVVVDYEFGINGNNDNARLWINPDGSSFGATVAPAATTNITIAAASGNQLGQAANFFLYCRSGATLWGSILISDLRIGTTWSFVTGGPEFTNQPLSQTVAAGATVTLQAAAVAGGSDVSYRWKLGGVNLTNGGIISGATTSTLTLTGVTTTNAGSYSVMAYNASGAVTSAPATLMVQAPLLVASAPQSRVERVGDNLAFSASFSSSASYQWHWNRSPIPGATNTSLVLTNIQTTNAGTYTIVATNSTATASATATLTVSTGRLQLSPTNLVVARVGDGAQLLNTSNGNTLYLDQFTPERRLFEHDHGARQWTCGAD